MPSAIVWKPSNDQPSSLITTKTTWGSSEVTDVLDGGITVRYRANVNGSQITENFTADTLYVDLTPAASQPLVPDTAVFSVGNRIYYDRLGRIVSALDHATGAGVDSGAVDPSTGLASLAIWNEGSRNSYLHAGLTALGDVTASDFVFMAPTRPLVPGSVQILATTEDGTSINETVPTSGILASQYLSGIVNVATGVFHLRFGYWKAIVAGDESLWQYNEEHIRESDGKIWWPVPVIANTIRVNATATSFLPVDKSEIGVNPSAFPGNGLAIIFEKGMDVVIHHEASLPLTGPIAPSSVHLAGRDRLYRVRVTDANGLDIPSSASTWTEYKTSTDGLLGVQFAPSPTIDLSAYVQPFTLWHQIIDRNRILDKDISGLITLERQLSHVFPAPGSYISSAKPLGNMLVSVPVAFTQSTWTSVWSDTRIGSEPIMQYQSATHPIELKNDGAITDRWAFVMAGQTTYDCYSEGLGVVARGVSINADFAPANTLTGKPYFTVRAGFLGQGGSVGNVFRFNTTAANRPVWPIVTVLPGNSLISADQFQVQVIGNGASS